MTYDTLIDKIKKRCVRYLKGSLNYDVGVIFNVINDAIRDMARTSKDVVATPATLSLVAGTRDYTISSAIASDVRDIVAIYLDTGEIKPATAWSFQKEIFKDVSDEDEIVTGTPEFYRIVNGVLRVYPTPNEAKSATVHYVKKIAADVYSTSNGAATVPIDDRYLNALQYESIAMLLENLGQENKAEYYRSQGKIMFGEAMADRSFDDDQDVVTYRDPVYN